MTEERATWTEDAEAQKRRERRRRHLRSTRIGRRSWAGLRPASGRTWDLKTQAAERCSAACVCQISRPSNRAQRGTTVVSCAAEAASLTSVPSVACLKSVAVEFFGSSRLRLPPCAPVTAEDPANGRRCGPKVGQEAIKRFDDLLKELKAIEAALPRWRRRPRRFRRTRTRKRSNEATEDERSWRSTRIGRRSCAGLRPVSGRTWDLKNTSSGKVQRRLFFQISRPFNRAKRGTTVVVMRGEALHGLLAVHAFV